MRSESRSRLREFQSYLANRLVEAKAAQSTANQLGIQINDVWYLVPLDQVGELTPLQDIAAVPHTFAWYKGLTNVRGNLFSVVDLTHLLYDSPTRVERESRFLSFAPALEVNAGILITRTLGLHNTAQWQRDDECCVDPQGREWELLDLLSLVHNEKFMQISALSGVSHELKGD
jgi:twitching motility protein PilI